MRVGLYQDPRGSGMGGGEYILAVLAAALRAEGHAVDLVHHQGERFVAKLADFFRMGLSGVGDRPLPPPGRWDAPDSPRLGPAVRDWMRDASEPYDLFVCTTHQTPPYCHARAGVLYVLFPFFDRRTHWAWGPGGRGLSAARGWLRRRRYESLWQGRFRTYSSVAAISEFSRKWTREYWGPDTEVIPPPVDVAEFAPGEKIDRVLVLGRFTRAKAQLGLVTAFRRNRDRLPGWSMACLGGLPDTVGDRAYFAEVEVAADGSAELVPDAPRERVRTELAQARVFWHGMGIGTDESADPTKAEHFGIATVEAMAAGCVPIVPNSGGQREIVTQGETGFLCTDYEEFAGRTAELAADPARATRMAAAARDAAGAFSRPAFVSRMMQLLRPHLTPAGRRP